MADEVINISDTHYILATSPRIDDRTQVLKRGDTFAVFDRFGDIEKLGSGELGLYYQDTRYLSHLSLRMKNQRPLLLNSTIKDDNAILSVDVMNPDVRHNDEILVPRGTIHMFRSRILWEATCHERLRIHNYGEVSVAFAFTLAFAADFADIFEVRGMQRQRRGRSLPPKQQADELLFEYEGLDGRLRRTRIRFDPPPDHFNQCEACYVMTLAPRTELTFQIAIGCEATAPANNPHFRTPTPKPQSITRNSYDEAVENAAESLRRARAEEAEVSTSNEQFNDWLNRSTADLHMMKTEMDSGPYPYAGVPWFSTPFGRDGIITAFECLWFSPAIARGVLAYLAGTQATAINDEQDAQPGKILHEARAGEMANLGEVPFSQYYGAVDSTPLFVMLAWSYYERTGDQAFILSIWPNIERALHWMDCYGDSDGDGFVEYTRRSPHGLIQQGWKDSHDSVFHQDGSAAQGPIALCEVQGYVYAAKCGAARIARLLGHEARAQELEDQALLLRKRFDEAFWCEDLGTYALALDGNKQRCQVVTSNTGHCLFAGIVPAAKAARVAAALTADSSFSGWGIRTLANMEVRYNPMSYHNGSIWPHDNALTAAGFGRYGLKREACAVMTGLLDASIFFDQHRLPELFCGFRRRPGEGPTRYPVACSPQTWASAAVYLLLQSCLGLNVMAAEKKLLLCKPYLPGYLDSVTVRKLTMGKASVDLVFTRHEESVGINVLQRRGDIDVIVHT